MVRVIIKSVSLCEVFDNSPKLISCKQIFYSTAAWLSNNAAGLFSDGRVVLRNFSTALKNILVLSVIKVRWKFCQPFSPR